jgi:probable HAF family extracellular repeat protein
VSTTSRDDQENAGRPIAVALLGLFAFAVVGASQSYAQCEYEVTVIQHPPCGIFGPPNTTGYGLNELGHVVGDHESCDSTYDEAFVWTPESDLVTLEMPPGTVISSAYDINEAGQIVGEFVISGEDLRGFLHDGDTVINLGTMPGGNFSIALAINSAGQVTGYWGNSASGPNHGFLWQDGVMSDLGPLVGTPDSRAYAINESGDVAGWMGSSTLLDARAFILEGESLTELPPIPGGFTSEARALNNDGDVAGRGRYADPDTGATVWRAFACVDEAMIRIDPLPDLSQSSARGINDAQQVVGIAWEMSIQRGFIWQHGILTDLNDLIPPEFYIGDAHAINNAGQIIGHGGFGTGAVGLLLTPVDQPPADFDHDCTVGVTDFLILLAAWGPCPQTGTCPGDANGDGTVNVLDFLLLLANWG